VRSVICCEGPANQNRQLKQIKNQKNANAPLPPRPEKQTHNTTVPLLPARRQVPLQRLPRRLPRPRILLRPHPRPAAAARPRHRRRRVPGAGARARGRRLYPGEPGAAAGRVELPGVTRSGVIVCFVCAVCLCVKRSVVLSPQERRPRARRSTCRQNTFCEPRAPAAAAGPFGTAFGVTRLVRSCVVCCCRVCNAVAGVASIFTHTRKSGVAQRSQNAADAPSLAAVLCSFMPSPPLSHSSLLCPLEHHAQHPAHLAQHLRVGDGLAALVLLNQLRLLVDLLRKLRLRELLGRARGDDLLLEVGGDLLVVEVLGLVLEAGGRGALGGALCVGAGGDWFFVLFCVGLRECARVGLMVSIAARRSDQAVKALSKDWVRNWRRSRDRPPLSRRRRRRRRGGVAPRSGGALGPRETSHSHFFVVSTAAPVRRACNFVWFVCAFESEDTEGESFGAAAREKRGGARRASGRSERAGACGRACQNGGRRRPAKAALCVFPATTTAPRACASACRAIASGARHARGRAGETVFGGGGQRKAEKEEEKEETHRVDAGLILGGRRRGGLLAQDARLPVLPVHCCCWRMGERGGREERRGCCCNPWFASASRADERACVVQRTWKRR